MQKQGGCKTPRAANGYWLLVVHILLNLAWALISNLYNFMQGLAQTVITVRCYKHNTCLFLCTADKLFHCCMLESLFLPAKWLECLLYSW